MNNESRNISMVRLWDILTEISWIDPSRAEYGMSIKGATEERYARRNLLVQEAVLHAQYAGLKAGYTVHEPITQLLPTPHTTYTEGDDGEAIQHLVASPVWEPRWGVVAYIELPTGQITWHMDSGEFEYDGHTDADKWHRIEKYLGDRHDG
jgi:hypothetical protein